MKKALIAAGALLISGCTTYAAPNYYNGNYYMGGDANCVQFRALSAKRVMCADKNGNETGYRDAMTPDEMQMYNMRRQQQSQNSSSLNNTVSCKKFGDLSGQIYQFSSMYCPYGYF